MAAKFKAVMIHPGILNVYYTIGEYVAILLKIFTDNMATGEI